MPQLGVATGEVGREVGEGDVGEALQEQRDADGKPPCSSGLRRVAARTKVGPKDVG